MKLAFCQVFQPLDRVPAVELRTSGCICHSQQDHMAQYLFLCKVADRHSDMFQKDLPSDKVECDLDGQHLTIETY